MLLDLTAYYGKHDLAKYTYFYFLPTLSRDIKLMLGVKISSYYGVYTLSTYNLHTIDSISFP
jgi:hypothetical protein